MELKWTSATVVALLLLGANSYADEQKGDAVKAANKDADIESNIEADVDPARGRDAEVVVDTELVPDREPHDPEFEAEAEADQEFSRVDKEQARRDLQDNQIWAEVVSADSESRTLEVEVIASKESDVEAGSVQTYSIDDTVEFRAVQQARITSAVPPVTGLDDLEQGDRVILEFADTEGERRVRHVAPDSEGQTGPVAGTTSMEAEAEIEAAEAEADVATAPAELDVEAEDDVGEADIATAETELDVETAQARADVEATEAESEVDATRSEADQAFPSVDTAEASEALQEDQIWAQVVSTDTDSRSLKVEVIASQKQDVPQGSVQTYTVDDTVEFRTRPEADKSIVVPLVTGLDDLQEGDRLILDFVDVEGERRLINVTHDSRDDDV